VFVNTSLAAERYVSGNGGGKMKRVVIIGMGFGGLRAAQALGGKGLDVTIIDRRNYHLFQPLLYQVASASLEQESIAYPIRAIVRDWKGVHFRLGEVEGVDFDGRQVRLKDGAVDYDYLIVAAGAATNFFGIKSLEENAFELKLLSQAVRLRNHLLEAFERADKEPDPDRRRAILSFVIIGGGPTGVEFAGALQELIRNELSRDFHRLSMTDTRIILVEAKGALLPALPEKLQQYTVDKLQRMGIEVMLNTQVSGADPEKVLLADGSILPAHTIVWSAGVQAAPLAAILGLPRAAAGRIPVESDLSVAGRSDVFIVGDMAFLEQDGKPLPMVAPVAMQEGEYAGKTILARIKGQTLKPFRYRDKGAMATIGRSTAVANAFGIKFSGFPAWVVWLGLHLMYLVGFRNRLLVLLNWAYYYFCHAQQIRIITRDARSHSDD
jgi:NADH:ubiquinone reductase (H+-translocating)